MTFEALVAHPVKVAMFFLALVLLGLLSLGRLPLNLFPDVQTPQITIVARTTDLTPEAAERELTADFERQLSTVKGVAGITSYTREGSIVLLVDFHWGQDMEFAYLDAKKSIGLLETREDIERVEIYRFDPNSAALMTLAFTGEGDLVARSSLVENTLKPHLETLEGIAYVKANGLRRERVEVLLDQDVMANFKLTAQQVLEALQGANLSAPGGVVREGSEELELKLISRLENLDDIRRCVVTVIEDHAVRVEDLGEVRVALSPEEVLVRQDGTPTVSLDLYREPDANAVLTARRVRAEVARLNTAGGFSLKIAADRSQLIESALGEVVHAAWIGMLLAMAVLFAFLRRMGPTLIAGTAIPISIIATFLLMDIQNLSLNLMTLGGLALGVGMLVDNAIVVIENIFRFRQSGAEPGTAAARGTREVAAAITASTLTTIVVFVPLIYVHGIAGILFKDQALTVVYTLMISLLVALVLVPMLAARVKHQGRPPLALAGPVYAGLLHGSLRLRWFILIAFAGSMALTWHALSRLPVEFFPEATGARLAMRMALPAGSSLERSESAVRHLEQKVLALRWRDPALAPLLRVYEQWEQNQDDATFRIAAQHELERLSEVSPDHSILASLKPLLAEDLKPASLRWPWQDGQEVAVRRWRDEVHDLLRPKIIVKSVTATAGTATDDLETAGEEAYGPHTARLEITLEPLNLHEISASDVATLLRSEADQIPELSYRFEAQDEYLQELLAARHGDLTVEIHASELEDLREAAARVERALTAEPLLANVRSNLVWGGEAAVLEPDENALRRGGFRIEELEAQVKAWLQGEQLAGLKLARGEMDLALLNAGEATTNLRSLLSQNIVSADGARDQLGNLVHVRNERALAEIMHVGQERTLLVMADLTSGAPYDHALAALRMRLDKLTWPVGASWNMSGMETARRESFSRLLMALILAMVLTYMIIAAILESVLHPLTIMISVPFALSGIVLAFLWSGVSINLMGLIGIIMTIGIVVNNAIVMLDRVRQLRDEGLAVARALVDAACQRLRPILMTSLTTILGLIPLAIGFGNGVELRRPLALAVIGGLGSSTLLTLLILPAIYLCVEDFIRGAKAFGSSLAVRAKPQRNSI